MHYLQKEIKKLQSWLLVNLTFIQKGFLCAIKFHAVYIIVTVIVITVINYEDGLDIP